MLFYFNPFIFLYVSIVSDEFIGDEKKSNRQFAKKILETLLSPLTHFSDVFVEIADASQVYYKSPTCSLKIHTMYYIVWVQGHCCNTSKTKLIQRLRLATEFGERKKEGDILSHRGHLCLIHNSKLTMKIWNVVMHFFNSSH